MNIAIRSALIMCVFFLFRTGCRAQNIKLNAVKVEFAGFDIETPFDINCEAFEFSYVKDKTSKVFKNTDALLKFELLKRGFNPVARKTSFDVRGAIIYSYNNGVNRYCFDEFGYFYKDGKFYFSKELLIYLSDKLYTNHPQYLDTLRQYE